MSDDGDNPHLVAFAMVRAYIEGGDYRERIRFLFGGDLPDTVWILLNLASSLIQERAEELEMMPDEFLDVLRDTQLDIE